MNVYNNTLTYFIFPNYVTVGVFLIIHESSQTNTYLKLFVSVFKSYLCMCIKILVGLNTKCFFTKKLSAYTKEDFIFFENFFSIYGV